MLHHCLEGVKKLRVKWNSFGIEFSISDLRIINIVVKNLISGDEYDLQRYNMCRTIVWSTVFRLWISKSAEAPKYDEDNCPVMISGGRRDAGAPYESAGRLTALILVPTCGTGWCAVALRAPWTCPEWSNNSVGWGRRMKAVLFSRFSFKRLP